MKRKVNELMMVILLVGAFALTGCGGSGSKAGKSASQLTEADKAMIGEWVSKDEGEDSLSLSFQDDFTVDVTLNDRDTEECTWVIKDEVCVMTGEEVDMKALINEDGTLTVYYPAEEEEEWYVFECTKAE